MKEIEKRITALLINKNTVTTDRRLDRFEEWKKKLRETKNRQRGTVGKVLKSASPHTPASRLQEKKEPDRCAQGPKCRGPAGQGTRVGGSEWRKICGKKGGPTFAAIEGKQKQGTGSRLEG